MEHAWDPQGCAARPAKKIEGVEPHPIIPCVYYDELPRLDALTPKGRVMRESFTWDQKHASVCLLELVDSVRERVLIGVERLTYLRSKTRKRVQAWWGIQYSRTVLLVGTTRLAPEPEIPVCE